MSQAASLPGTKRFPENHFFEEATCPGQLRCLGQSVFLKSGLSGSLGLLRAEQDVQSLKKCTFGNSGTPVRRTRRPKSQQMHFQEFSDSCAQNKTSEMTKIGLSRILGLLCAEQDVGNLKKYIFKKSGTPVRTTRRRKYQNIHFLEFWDSCAQNKTSEI